MDDKIWVLERTDSGYRVSHTTRSQEAVKDWVAIAIVIIGGVLVYILSGGALL